MSSPDAAGQGGSATAQLRSWQVAMARRTELANSPNPASGVAAPSRRHAPRSSVATKSQAMHTERFRTWLRVYRRARGRAAEPARVDHDDRVRRGLIVGRPQGAPWA